MFGVLSFKMIIQNVLSKVHADCEEKKEKSLSGWRPLIG